MCRSTQPMHSRQVRCRAGQAPSLQLHLPPVHVIHAPCQACLLGRHLLYTSWAGLPCIMRTDTSNKRAWGLEAPHILRRGPLLQLAYPASAQRQARAAHALSIASRFCPKYSCRIRGRQPTSRSFCTLDTPSGDLSVWNTVSRPSRTAAVRAVHTTSVSLISSTCTATAV